MSITPSLVASRTSGTVPLYVHFDATATVSTTENTLTKAFRNLLYKHDFGDPAGGETWGVGAQTGLSKNAARSAVAAHTYKSAGSYTHTVTITDGVSVVQVTTGITGNDPNTVYSGTATVCIGQATLPVAGVDGVPAGAECHQDSSFPNIVSTYCLGGKRVLLKHDDTWTPSSTAVLAVNNATGGTLGMYGSGAKPKIASTQSGGAGVSILQISSTGTPNFSDWRIMDLEIDGTNATNIEGIRSDFLATKILMLRLNVHHTPNGGLTFPESATIFSDFGVVDCSITQTSYAAYFAAATSAFMGCTMTNTAPFAGVGVWRTQYYVKSIFSNNTMSGSPSGFHLFKFGAIAGGAFSEQSVVSDNYFDDRTGSGGWMVAMGPQNAGSDERVRDCVVERNWFRSGTSATEVQLKLWSSKMTVRNNLFDMSGGSTAFNDNTEAVHVDQRGVEPAPDDNTIVNNTMYRSDGIAGPNNLNGVRLQLGTNMVVKNNVGYSPNVSGAVFLVDFATGTSASNNSTDAQMRSTSPSFASSTPTAIADFKILTGSYAKGAGATLAVALDDCFRTSRIGVANDMGFHQFVAGSDPGGAPPPPAYQRVGAMVTVRG